MGTLYVGTSNYDNCIQNLHFIHRLKYTGSSTAVQKCTV